MKRLATRVFRRRCRNGCKWASLLVGMVVGIATARSVFAAAETLAKADFPDEQAAQQYWGDRERGWFWYREPPRENKEQSKATPRAAAPTAPARPGRIDRIRRLAETR